MSQKRRNRRKGKKKQPLKNNVSNKDKIIWFGIVGVVILLFCFLLFLQFIKYFISIEDG